MTSTGMGAANIVGEDGKLAGIITDGDIRRHLEKSPDLLNKLAGEIMTVNPKTILKDKLAAEALKIMQDYEIEDLPVVNENDEPLGLINFQDLLKAGVL
jgi:arabinose-5-phosphate isomerase